jgi:hypothetical protein
MSQATYSAWKQMWKFALNPLSHHEEYRSDDMKILYILRYSPKDGCHLGLEEFWENLVFIG